MRSIRYSTALLMVFAGMAAAQDAKKGKDDKFTPYDEVITEDAETDKGLFTVHRVDDKLFYEIVPDAFGDELLWVTQIGQTTEGYSYAGMPVQDRVVRFERRGDNVLLRDVRYDARADTDDSISIAVSESNLEPIIKSMPIKAFGKDQSVVIDVTGLFTKDVKEFSAAGSLGAGGMDAGRSFIEQVKSFPENIETKVLATYSLKGNAAESSSGITALVHHSMVKLPDDPMEPREFDSRVGFFTVGFNDYADESNHDAKPKRYITRWRLEKKDPEAELSEPVEPIVFYVGRETPDKWKPYVKQGIEDWLPAFEEAGFKNAIVGKYPPDPDDDPNWDPEDARISSIRWLASEIPNAFGPHVHDPRTGEILEADVRMYHNVMRLVRDWYFVQAGPSDPRSQQIPLPDDVMGECIRFVVAHEVGHSLGFPHNFKASNAYTIEQLRDPEWTSKNGTAPSIMDYARFNYVAQPGDGATLIPMVGPYDKFAVRWGYSQFPEEADVDAALDEIASEQVDNPILRFGVGGFTDHTNQTEDLGDDAVEATRLGLANLERIMGYLLDATAVEGEDYRMLDALYDAVLAQWAREMGHVSRVVGGVENINYFYGDGDQRFFPLEGAKQREALNFLLENAFTTPEAFIPDDIVLRLTGAGVADRVLGQQVTLLQRLTSESRIDRMSEHAERQGNGYPPMEMMRDLTDGLMVELADGDRPDVYRRNLQRAYVDGLASILDDPASGSDRPAIARMELTYIADLARDIDTRDDTLAAHAMDLAARIEEALDTD